MGNDTPQTLADRYITKIRVKLEEFATLERESKLTEREELYKKHQISLDILLSNYQRKLLEVKEVAASSFIENNI